MRKLVVAAAAALLVSACGSEKSGTFETDDGTGSYKIDQDSGQTAMEITGPDGQQVNISSGKDASVDLPDGFAIYPGSEIVSNTTINQGAGKGTMVTMHSADSAADMIGYYKKQAEAAGIEIEMELKTGQGQMISGKDGSGTAFSFNANPGDDGTTGQLIIGKDLGS